MRPVRLSTHVILLAAFGLVLLLAHLPYLTLPLFWDELGQFVPAALDIARDGAWVPHSTTPNVHPPGVMAWLALVYRVFGYSIVATRLAMLCLAAAGVYVTFLLAIRLCRATPGAPAYPAVVFLLVSPLFYMQSMMAQLDMPAMVFTALSLLLFLEERWIAAAAACTVLVLVKETGAVLPAVFGAWLLWRERRLRRACYFIFPFVALGIWLFVLRHATGHMLGDAGFAHYNVEYSLQPVRAASTLVRRFYYLFIAEFRWVGALALGLAVSVTRLFRNRAWAVTGLIFAGHVVLVSVLGGAALERYLLPMLPILYIGMAAAFSYYRRRWRVASQTVLVAGLIASLFWNPPYPFPYENNLAMVDFVDLQQAAAEHLENNYSSAAVASAWPFTGALRNPEFGYVARGLRTIETSDFHAADVVGNVVGRADVLVVYSRTWEPELGVLRLGWVERYLREYWDYEPQIGTADIRRRLGLVPVARWMRRGQWIEIYARPGLGRDLRASFNPLAK